MSNVMTSAKTIWTNPTPEEDEPSLVRLTADALCLACIPAEDLEKAVADLEAGSQVVSQNIPLGKITTIEGHIDNSETVSLTVTYKVSDSQTETAEFQLPQRKDWDEFSEQLLQRFGPGWERKEERESRWSSAFWPGLVTVIAGLVSGWMYHEASLIAQGRKLSEHGSGRTKVLFGLMHLIEGWIGPTGVLILGGIVVLLGLLWIWYSIASPGVNVVLRSREGS
jgi:hypothetical protein